MDGSRNSGEDERTRICSKVVLSHQSLCIPNAIYGGGIKQHASTQKSRTTRKERFLVMADKIRAENKIK